MGILYGWVITNFKNYSVASNLIFSAIIISFIISLVTNFRIAIVHILRLFLWQKEVVRNSRKFFLNVKIFQNKN